MSKYSFHMDNNRVIESYAKTPVLYLVIVAYSIWSKSREHGILARLGRVLLLKTRFWMFSYPLTPV